RTAPLQGIDMMVGPFINTLPVRVDLFGDMALMDWLREQQRQSAEQRKYEHCPLVDVQRASGVAPGTPLFEYLYVFENFPTERNVAAAGKLTIRLRELDVAEHTNYPLTCVVMPKGELRVRLVYATNRFTEASIEQFLQHMEQLLETFAKSPQCRLNRISLLSDTERHGLLSLGCGVGAEFPVLGGLVERFSLVSGLRVSSVAVSDGVSSLTYGELGARAHQLAWSLRGLGVGPESVVGLCLERSVDTVVGILGILQAGGAYLPLDPGSPPDRLAFMLADSQARVVVTQASLQPLCAGSPAHCVCLDTASAVLAPPSREAPALTTHPDQAAYVIYTSGSTGQPKGCVVTHANVLRLLDATHADYQFDHTDVWTLFHSFAFDFSVWELWGALLYGGRLVVVPYLVSRSPAEFHRLLVDEHVTVLNQTPSAFLQFRDADAQAVTEDRLALKWVIFGGESLQPARLESWFQRHGDQHPTLVNMYGITETTVHVTYQPLTRETAASGAGSPIGRPLPDLEVYLLDAALEPVPVGVPGELYVGGAGLARGYLARPGLTASRFLPHPFGERHGERLYRTGDLARWLPDGTLDFLGRGDQQVKIRGFRIELGEIEAVLTQHPSVRQAAVIARPRDDGQPQLLAYVVPRGGESVPPVEDLRHHLGRSLPEYMLPAHFISLPQLPLTANGKLDTNALPEPRHDRGPLASEFVPPRTPIETTLAHIWKELLQLPQVGIHDNFFALGGHSLLVTQVISRVRSELAVDLPLRELFDKPTIATMALLIEQEQLKGQARHIPPITRADRAGYLPLSFAQERLWFLDQLVPDNPFYNIPRVVRLRGTLNLEALQQTLDEIVRRHEPLRTTIATQGGRGVQQIWPAASLEIPLIDLTSWSLSNRETEARRIVRHEAQQPFNLTQGPLVRALVIRLDSDDHIVFWLMHHIVSDGWSMGVLNGEVAALYGAFAAGKASPLPELPIQYADFALWQRNWLTGPVLEEQIEYWRQQLADLPPLALPTDRPRPALQTYRGNSVSLPLSAELRTGLNELSRREGVTLFMTMLAVFKVLLSRYSGQQDIVVSSPIAGRIHRDLEGLIGFFVNSLILRTDLSGQPTVRELLARMREVCLGAYAHQDLPYEKLVFELQPQRDLSREPLTQVAFVLQNTPKAQVPLTEGLTLSLVEAPSDTTRIDLEVHIWEHGDAF
ncbi:MAG: amino acid adenylation domain-containing protein, partial [Planctomycetaceae bacterium]|nr:amino acid adenylation domain-containing protein [Planctomycetaceae bacterium]